MPEAYLKNQKRDDAGQLLLGLDYPSFFPFMENATNGEARKRYYMAKFTQGGKDNLERLYEIFKLRQELAGLYGLPSFAAYALRHKMVLDVETVDKFLDDVKGAVTDLEKKEIAELRAEKAKDEGTPVADTKFERYDLLYYQEKVRRARYDVDQEKLRKYFPTDKSVDYVFARLAAPVRREVPRGEGACLESRRALLRRARRRHRQVPVGLLHRPLSRARASTATPRPSRCAAPALERIARRSRRWWRISIATGSRRTSSRR